DRHGSDRRGGSDNHRSSNNNYSGSNNKLNVKSIQSSSTHEHDPNITKDCKKNTTVVTPGQADKKPEHHATIDCRSYQVIFGDIHAPEFIMVP
nr:hypothetical protein [Tanacetum cinerariifolium]